MNNTNFKSINYIYKLSKKTTTYLGFISTQENYRIQLNFEETDSSELALRYFTALMEKMASKGYKPEKKNVLNRNPWLGSTLYTFNPLYPNPETNGYGEGIFDGHGIIYRETGSNFYIAELNTNYNYDIVLSQIITFSKNIPEKIVNYNYQGDFYDPIKYTWSYDEKSDSTLFMKFNGVYADPETYEATMTVVDTTFELPFCKQTSFDKGGGKLLDSDEFFNFFPKKVFDSVYLFEMNDCTQGEALSNVQIVSSAYALVNSKRSKAYIYQMIGLSSAAKTGLRSKGYPFYIYDDHSNFRKQFQLSDANKYNRSEIDTIILKTVHYLFFNSKIKKIKHLVYNLEHKKWVEISTEEYSKDGQLLSLDLKWNNLDANYVSYFGERADLGFIENNMRLEDCVITYNEEKNIRITSKNGDPIIQVKAGELQISVNYRSGDFIYEEIDPDINPNWNCGDNCPSSYLIIRKK